MKIALVGLGSIGARHLDNLLALGVRDVVVVSKHFNEGIFRTHDTALPVVSNLSDIIDEVDVVVIANATSLHFDLLKYAVNHNKHVYIEKPVSCNSSHMNEILKEANDNKLSIGVGTQFRFNERLLKLKQLIERNVLGDIYSVMSSHGEHIASYHPDEDYKTSYAVDSSCGGVLLTQIHHIDYLNWLFGPFRYAYANEMATPFLGIDCDTVVNYSLVSDENDLQIHGHMNYIQKKKSTVMHIVGKKGTAYWNYEENLLSVEGIDDNFTDVSPLDRNDMFVATMCDFLEAVEKNGRPAANLEDGIESVKIVDAIKQSINSNCSVEIGCSFIG